MTENVGHVVTKLQFKKTGVYPLNDDAITIPSLSTSSAESSFMETTFSSNQLVCFQERYNNGYDIFVDKDYCKWLSLYHPEALLDDLGDDDAPVDPSNGSSSPDGGVPVDPNNNSAVLTKNPLVMKIATLQERYETGYDLVFDKDYIILLTLHHPDVLPQHANIISFPEEWSYTNEC